MKIYVMYKFMDGPYGGANQFLKAMKDYFVKNGYCTENIREADLVLFNSSNDANEVLQAKRSYPNKIFIERLDGPARFYVYQPKRDKRDLIANTMNRYIADATIFQSQYSREANYQLGLNKNIFETTIINAPDETIFNKNEKKKFNQAEKVCLIASSWSANWNKGFEIYQYLDNYLDFNKYEMLFVGNAPIPFKNIQKIDPLSSKDLADLMKKCDIYITASENDPCSNSLIEAIFCGLPALALKKGGHPEIVGKAGQLFENKEEIIPLLEDIVQNYELYVRNFSLAGRDETGQKYIKFMSEVLKSKKEKKWKAKRVNFVHFIWIKLILLYVIFNNKYWNIIKRIEGR